MRLIKICLGENNPFWFLGDIHLTSKDPVSPQFDIDKLSREGKQALDSSIKRCKIKAFDIEGNRLNSLGSHKLVGGGAFDEEEEDPVRLSDLPEIVSVTCEEDDEEEDEEETSPTEKDYEEAEILLKKNGNTVRKAISMLLVNRDTISLLLACQNLEKNQRNRKGVLKELKNKIGDYYGD